MTKLTNALGVIILTTTANVAYAQDSRGFSAELEIETSAVSTFSADDPAAEINDIHAEITLGLGLELGGGFSLFSEVLLEQVIDPTKDAFFDDHGLYVSELGLSFSNDAITISGGKISPAFGLAWDAAPGFFGADIAEDYELGEAIGGSVEVPFKISGGDHSVTASVFYADTSALSDSIITKRGRNNLAAGGAGNTEKLNNFAVQLAGAFGDTEYNLSFRQLSAGVGDIGDETGGSLGVQHSFDLNGNDFTILGEVARFDQFGGTADDVTYGTLGAAYTMDKWSFSASYTGRNGVGGFNDYLASVGVDYDFGNDLIASIGLSRFDEANQTADTIALSVYKAFSFGG